MVLSKKNTQKVDFEKGYPPFYGFSTKSFPLKNADFAYSEFFFPKKILVKGGVPALQT